MLYQPSESVAVQLAQRGVLPPPPPPVLAAVLSTGLCLMGVKPWLPL